MLNDEFTTYFVPVDVVSVRGVDAASYLNGQLSQNVVEMAQGETKFSLLLAPQGFVEAWLRVVRRDADEYWLIVDRSYGSNVVSRLDRFKLRVDCIIECTEMTWTALRSKSGRDLTAAERATAQDLLGLEPDHVLLSLGWPGDAGADIIGPGNVNISRGKVGSADGFERRRLRARRPAMGSELTKKTIPASLGVVDLSVDFSKGCYVGQELVARVDSRGNNTPTTLYSLEFDGAVSVGTDIVDESGSIVGSITSATRDQAKPLALAFIKRGTDLVALAASTATGMVPAKVL